MPALQLNSRTFISLVFQGSVSWSCNFCSCLCNWLCYLWLFFNPLHYGFRDTRLQSDDHHYYMQSSCNWADLSIHCIFMFYKAIHLILPEAASCDVRICFCSFLDCALYSLVRDVDHLLSVECLWLLLCLLLPVRSSPSACSPFHAFYQSTGQFLNRSLALFQKNVISVLRNSPTDRSQIQMKNCTKQDYKKRSLYFHLMSTLRVSSVKPSDKWLNSVLHITLRKVMMAIFLLGSDALEIDIRYR